MITTEQKIYAERNEIKDAFVELVVSMKPTHFLTATTNQVITAARGPSLLKQFLYQVVLKTLGKNHYRFSKKHRIKSISFVENLNSNFHYHSLLHVPPIQSAKFSRSSNSKGREWWLLSRTQTDKKYFPYSYFHSVWEQLCPSGQLDIAPLKDQSDVYRTASYSIKQIYMLENYQNFIILGV